MATSITPISPTAHLLLRVLVATAFIFVTPSLAQSTTTIRCNDGSPSGTGGFTSTSGCAATVNFYRAAGCTVSVSDTPTGEVDTLTVSCPGAIPPLDPNIDPDAPDGKPEDSDPVGTMDLCDYTDFLRRGVVLYCVLKDVMDPDVPTQRIRLSFTSGGFEGSAKAKRLRNVKAAQASGEYSQVISSTPRVRTVYLSAQNIDKDGKSTGDWVPITTARTRTTHVCPGGRNVPRRKVQQFREELAEARVESLLRPREERNFATGSMCKRQIGSRTKVKGSSTVEGNVNPARQIVHNSRELQVSEKQQPPIVFQENFSCTATRLGGSEGAAERSAVEACEDNIRVQARASAVQRIIDSPGARDDLATFACMTQYTGRGRPIWRLPLWVATIRMTAECLITIRF